MLPDSMRQTMKSSAGISLVVSAIVIWWMPSSNTGLSFNAILYLAIAVAVGTIVLLNAWTWKRISTYRAEFRDQRYHRFGVQGVGLTLAAGLAAINVNRTAALTSGSSVLAATLLFLVLFAAVAPITLWAGLAVGARLDGWSRSGSRE